MSRVATLYVRDVPERLYKRLRARARTNGRSLNAEVLAILERIDAEVGDAEISRRLAEIAKRVRRPEDAPHGEDLVRQGRDERDQKLRRLGGF
jgi:plasmid stability protein